MHPDSPRKNTERRRLNTKGKIVTGLSFVFLLAGFILLMHCLLHAEKKEGIYTFELGEKLPDDPAFYLDAGPLARLLADCDYSAVNESVPGIYKFSIRYPGKEFTFVLELKDTVSPEVTLKEGPFYFLPGTRIRPADFLAGVKDADPYLDISFDTQSMEEGATFCRDIRRYTARIVVSDSSGNASLTDVPFTVDCAPELIGVKDFYISGGADADILSFVSAVDTTDGDLSDSIVMELSPEDIPEEGEVSASFTVTDSCGFTASKTVTLFVTDPDEIQQLISSRKITHSDFNIIGAYNAYDTGAFEGEDFSETMEGILPALVHVRISKDDGSSTIGSGFIAEITESDIYVITNKHVVGRYTESEITFSTGDSAAGNVVGTADEYDIAVVKIPLSGLPDRIESELNTVHIDLSYWESLDDERPDLGMEILGPDGNVDHITYGSLVKKQGVFPFFPPFTETEMVLALRPGDSGSAVFDSCGRLMGMAFAYSVSPERDWAVPLDEIIKAYEEITGRKLYIY